MKEHKVRLTSKTTFWTLPCLATILLFALGIFVCFHDPEKSLKTLLPVFIPFSSLTLSYIGYMILPKCIHKILGSRVNESSLAALNQPILKIVVTYIYVFAMILCGLAIYQRAYTPYPGEIFMNLVLFIAFFLIPSQGIIIQIEAKKRR